LNNNGADSSGKNSNPAKIPSVSQNLNNNLPAEIAEQYGRAYGNQKSTTPIYGNNYSPSTKVSLPSIL
jgi:hypothetical protein